jgi:predicted ATPase
MKENDLAEFESSGTVSIRRRCVTPDTHVRERERTSLNQWKKLRSLGGGLSSLGAFRRPAAAVWGYGLWGSVGCGRAILY